MPRISEADSFDRTISRLIAKRTELAKGVAEIDDLFSKYGLKMDSSTSTVAVSRKPLGKPLRASSKRRQFAQTADEFVLAFVRSKKDATTADVNAAWKKSGRGGVSDNSLGKLVREKKLKRTPVKGGRGSTYSML